MSPRTKESTKQQSSGFAERDELAPEEIGEDGDEHDEQPACPLRPGQSIGGFHND